MGLGRAQARQRRARAQACDGCLEAQPVIAPIVEADGVCVARQVTVMDVAPTISVLMSVYNGERYLSAAMDSILSQSFRDFELIVIDDGSKDSSPAILQDYAGRDPRV